MTTPTSLDLLTVEWLGVQLEDRLGGRPQRIEVHRIGAGEGFMGQLARVAVHLDSRPDPVPVIVKLPTGDPGARLVGEMMRVWRREHCFYRDVAPRSVVRIPTALVNLDDPPCLVLEDLAPMSPGDHVAGATLRQAELAIDVLASHHAAWFQHPDLAGFDWLPGIDDPMVRSLAPMFELGWPAFLQRFASTLPSRALRWCERFVGGVPEWLEGYASVPVTLTHGDFRLDNIFFGDAGDVAVIDWQMAMRAPGQADLVYFCANNLSTELRRQHEHALIERYVTGLHAHGVPVDAVTVESVRRGYLEGLVFYAVSFGASLLTIDPSNERGAALFEVLVRRTFAALDDLDAGAAMGLGG